MDQDLIVLGPVQTENNLQEEFTRSPTETNEATSGVRYHRT